MKIKEFSGVLDILERYAVTGLHIDNIGSRLIGKAPSIAPMARIHTLFKPLSLDDIFFLENKIGLSIKESFRFFMLNISNGLSVFTSSFSINGLRKINSRELNGPKEPYSIISINLYQRPRDSSPNYLYIGGYSWDGSNLYIDNNTQKVYRCSSISSKPLNEWPNFETMLLSEVTRLTSLFDMNGKKLDVDKPTVPDPDVNLA